MSQLKRSLLLALVITAVACQVAEAGPIHDIVSQVSLASYQNYLDNCLYTRLGDNRQSITGAHHDLARDFIRTEFVGFGLTTSLDAFQDGVNVVGVHVGTVTPNRIYIIGAHYDSISSSDPGSGANAGAPGADDNASGVAGILEAARVISQYQLEATVMFIAFDREEQVMLGSTHYATAHAGDDIRGMLSLDMIAYSGSNPDKVLLHPGPGSVATRDALADALWEYAGISTPTQGQFNWSDHAPFGSFGEGSCLVIEHDFSSNPHYHRWSDSVDTVGYIDYAYATSITKGVVGYVLDNAILVIPEPGTASLAIAGTLGLFILLGRRTRRGEPAPG
ncbi:MAG: M20/M25/M40 family metallo-hydrolase, partial [Patescibacteria group bacterium]|nr:M20/M25/M40 family metallo-hydrolase [Patescibacteria group bacterium]